MGEGERFYPREGQHAGKLASNLEATYLAQGYRTQMLPMEDGSLVVQIRKEDTLKTITGTSESVSISIGVWGDDLKVKVGEGKWIDKVGAGVAGWFLLWPLLFTAGYGAFRQGQLVNEVWTFIDSFLRSAPHEAGAPPPPPPSPPPPQGATKSCPECRAVVRAGAAFCPHCGKQLMVKCASCGAAMEAADRFCPACGAKRA